MPIDCELTEPACIAIARMTPETPEFVLSTFRNRVIRWEQRSRPKSRMKGHVGQLLPHPKGQPPWDPLEARFIKDYWHLRSDKSISHMINARFWRGKSVRRWYDIRRLRQHLGIYKLDQRVWEEEEEAYLLEHPTMEPIVVAYGLWLRFGKLRTPIAIMRKRQRLTYGWQNGYNLCKEAR